MRTTLFALALVLVGASQTGCRHCANLGLPCPPDAPCPPSGPTPPTTSSEAPQKVVVQAPQPEVEVRAPETIHVKAPPQKITVTLPPNYDAGAGCADGSCARAWGGPQGPGVMSQAAPQYAPQPQYAPAPQYAPVAGAPAGLIGSTQTVRQRNRFALGMGVFRLPLPYPKLLTMPGEQEVVTRQTYQAPQAPSPAAFAPVMAAPVQYAPVAQAPVQYAPVAQAPVMAAPAPMQYAPVAQAPVQYAPVQYAPVPPPVQYAPIPSPQPQAALIPTTIQGTICVPTPGTEPCPPAAVPKSHPHR